MTNEIVCAGGQRVVKHQRHFMMQCHLHVTLTISKSEILLILRTKMLTLTVQGPSEREKIKENHSGHC